MTELEAKFLLSDECQVREVVETLRSASFEVVTESTVSVIDRYFDTKAWNILRAGWVYRWRESNGKRTIGLKAAGSSPDLIQRREEVEQPVCAFPENDELVAPGVVTQTVRELTPAPPRELFQVNNARQTYLVRSTGGCLIEMAHDRVEITATESPGRLALGKLVFQELELELKEGSEDELRSLAVRLQHQIGLLPSRLNKFERGLQTVGLTIPSDVREALEKKEEFLAGGDAAPRKKVKKRHPAAKLAARVLLEKFQEMLREEPKAWEGLDPEGVHRMRVATRRMRAALHSFRPVLPECEAKDMDAELKWLSGVLGCVRDFDVLLQNADQFGPQLSPEDTLFLPSYREYLEKQWAAARECLLVCLTDERYRTFKERWLTFVRMVASQDSADSINEVASQSLGRKVRRVVRIGRAITNQSPDEDIHHLRIECKRLRYMVEVFLPIYGKRLRRWVKNLKALQSDLGEFQDACVAGAQLREFGGEVPLCEENRPLFLAIGQLIEHQRTQAKCHREGFREAWDRFDRKGRRKEILALLRRG